MLVSPFLHDRQTTTDLATNFLQESDKLCLRPAGSSRSWVNSGEERERSADDGIVTDLRVMQVRGPRVAGLLLKENFSGLRVVEIVEEVGLITCERGVIGQRARLFNGRSAQGILLRRDPHGRGKGRSQSSGGWSGRWERQMKSVKWGSKREQTITQAHDTWMGWRAQTLEPMSCDMTLQVRTNTRKKWRVRCTVYNPSVGCSRLPSALNDLATTNENIMSSTSFFPLPPWRFGRRRRIPTTFLVLMKRDGFWWFFSWFSVATVH